MRVEAMPLKGERYRDTQGKFTFKTGTGKKPKSTQKRTSKKHAASVILPGKHR